MGSFWRSEQTKFRLGIAVQGVPEPGKSVPSRLSENLGTGSGSLVLVLQDPLPLQRRLSMAYFEPYIYIFFNGPIF